MPEVLVEFGDVIGDAEGHTYTAKACGGQMPDGMWQGWIEFHPTEGGTPIRSGRETTQPNRQDTCYWATGLTRVYLEGALRRALKPLVRAAPREIPQPAFERPAPPFEFDSGSADSVLNPFSVYRKGEELLRRQLAALSRRHLINIIRHYRLAGPGETLDAMAASRLVELIVSSVKRTPVSNRAS